MHKKRQRTLDGPQKKVRHLSVARSLIFVGVNTNWDHQTGLYSMHMPGKKLLELEK